MWLTKLKIAIVEKNVENLSKLMQEIPQFEDAKKMQAAVCLIAEATELVSLLQNETASSMQQIKKSLEFIKSTRPNNTNKLDIRS